MSAQKSTTIIAMVVVALSMAERLWLAAGLWPRNSDTYVYYLEVARLGDAGAWAVNPMWPPLFPIIASWFPLDAWPAMQSLTWLLSLASLILFWVVCDFLSPWARLLSLTVFAFHKVMIDTSLSGIPDALFVFLVIALIPTLRQPERWSWKTILVFFLLPFTRTEGVLTAAIVIFLLWWRRAPKQVLTLGLVAAVVALMLLSWRTHQVYGHFNPSPRFAHQQLEEIVGEPDVLYQLSDGRVGTLMDDIMALRPQPSAEELQRFVEANPGIDYPAHPHAFQHLKNWIVLVLPDALGLGFMLLVGMGLATHQGRAWLVVASLLVIPYVLVTPSPRYVMAVFPFLAIGVGCAAQSKARLILMILTLVFLVEQGLKSSYVRRHHQDINRLPGALVDWLQQNKTGDVICSDPQLIAELGQRARFIAQGPAWLIKKWMLQEEIAVMVVDSQLLKRSAKVNVPNRYKTLEAFTQGQAVPGFEVLAAFSGDADLVYYVYSLKKIRPVGAHTDE